MAVEVKYNKSHHAGPDGNALIANRLRNSGEGSKPNEHAVHGTGPLRTHTNIHHAGHFVQPNTQAVETGPQEQAHHSAATTQDANPYGGDKR